MVLAVSPVFAALIWWVLPGVVLLFGIGYVMWITKYKRKYDSQTHRSVDSFRSFQNSFRRR